MSSYTYCGNNPINVIDPDGTYTDWIRNKYGDYLWDDLAINQETTRNGWEYVGKDIPGDADRLDILTEEDGKLYYKNTSNLFASVGNLIFGKGTFVEHKAYNPVEENFTGDLVGMSTWTVGGAVVMKGVKWGIARKIGGLGWGEGGMARNGVQLGSKLDYIFGKATGSVHNIERSTGMLRQLESVGIFDNSAGRLLLQNHLKNVYTGTRGLVQPNGYYLRESLLMGPRGGLKMESICIISKSNCAFS